MHMEFYSVLCGSLDGRRVWGRMVTRVCVCVCVCVAESLCCPLEAITTLLIGYLCAQYLVMSDSLQPHGL